MDTREHGETHYRHIGIPIPVELHTRLKVIAAREQKTIQEIVRGLLEAWVAKKEDA